jgi:hypothetical protein
MNPSQLSALALLIGAFRWTMDDLAMASWGHYLAGIDADTLRDVIDHWVLHESRPPSIADLVDRLAARRGADAESAWKHVRSILMSGGFRDRVHGGFQPRCFTGDLALEDAVASAGGWADLAKSDEKDLVWRKMDFVAAYAKQSGIHQSLVALTAGAKELTDGRS